jgi:hypothetical protein
MDCVADGVFRTCTRCGCLRCHLRASSNSSCYNIFLRWVAVVACIHCAAGSHFAGIQVAGIQVARAPAPCCSAGWELAMAQRSLRGSATVLGACCWSATVGRLWGAAMAAALLATVLVSCRRRLGVPLGVGQSQGPALGGECILGPFPVGVRRGGRAHDRGRVPDRLGTVPGPVVVVGLPEKHTVATFVSFVVVNSGCG